MDEWLTFFPAGLIAEIQADLSLGYAEAGVVFAALFLGGVVGNPIGTLLSDYVDRRWIAMEEPW